MQADELNWYRWALAMVLTGLGTAFFLWLGFWWENRANVRHSARAPEEFPRGLRIAHERVPAILAWGYVTMALVIIGYTIYTAVAHVNY
jgi:hypothetical protein